MNSLSLEFFEGAYTTAMPRFMEKHGDSFERWRQEGVPLRGVGADIVPALPKKAPQKAGSTIADEIGPRPSSKMREQFDLF